MPLLLREAIGGTIRRARTERQRTLRDVSREARVSLGYLSEIERGRKEPSSELLASICDALALPLPDLLDDVAESMRPVRPARPAQVVRPRPLALAGGIDPALRTAVEEAFGADPATGGTEAADGSDGPAEPAEVAVTETTTPEPAPEPADGTVTDRAGDPAPAATGPGGPAAPGDATTEPDGDTPDAGTTDRDDTEPTPTVRLVGLVAVGHLAGPVVYAA